MTHPRAVRRTRLRAWLPAALIVLAIVAGCGSSSTGSPSSQSSLASGSPASSATASHSPDNLEGGTGWLTRWREFVDAGLHVAAATDMPWFLPDSGLTDDISRPVDQIAGGMDGRGRAHPGTPEWMLDQLLTAEQGLRAITLDAAYALGDEARRGHLAPGTLGDVTILSGDVTTATPDEIRAMTVIATIVGGVTEYCADPELCRPGED